MSKVPKYTLAWSPAIEVYELYQTRGREALRIVPDSPEWFAWLDQTSSFAFVGKRGHYTARKEAKQRGGHYWSAYRATSEHLVKKYLGKTTDLSLARLEYIEGALRAQSESFLSHSETLCKVSTNKVVDDAHHGQKRRPLHPLLASKLHVPRPRKHLVPRAHLVERLKRGVEGALTLVSAPAGFGKTTLLAQWLVESGMPIAWLSLEAEDNNPTNFLSYLIAALQTLDAQIGTTALAMLRTPQPLSSESVVAVLGVFVSEVISRGSREFVLVLDDYHLITADSIHHGITFLMEHLPSQLHLVLASRTDPPLPLARLRVQGQLTEVRMVDLQFSTAETNAFLQEVMGLKLPPEAIATLKRRTEGWIVGLQLAGLSLQGRTDASGFLAAFSGSHRYVLDYLSEEVLARQPAAVKQFLLHTCLLERLSGSLCDAVIGQEGSQAMLEALERANLFVVALDDERHWYRYHHLFAEVLRSYLQQAEPEVVSVLHIRASTWYEQHGLPAEAVQHALAVPDYELAARLIEPLALSATHHGQIDMVLGWLKDLPEALLHTRPFLCVYYARLLIFTNQLEAAETLLQEAERGIEEYMTAEQARTIRGHVLIIRAGVVGFAGDMAYAVSLAHQALELLPETNIFPRTGAIMTTTHAYLVSGDVSPTIEGEVAAAVAQIYNSDNLFAIVSSISALARLHFLQGKLRQATATYAQVVQVVPQPEVLQTIFRSVFYYFGLGDLLRERNELDGAERHLSQGMALVKETLTVDPFVAVLGYTAMSRLQQARGNLREGLATLDALAHLAEQRHFPPQYVAQGTAVRTQLELAQGNLASAMRWADSSDLSIKDEELPYPREDEYLILARVCIAQGCNDPTTPLLQDVLHLLNRLQKSAEAKERIDSVLEILVLHALALEAQGNRTSALSTLERALMLAEPEGYIRLFVDEGAPMLTLLHKLHAQSRVPGYVATLLRVFGEQVVSDVPLTFARPNSLVEPLTEREREVLRLLLDGATNREIARRLIVSVNTVKRHVFNLCGKLGVQRRSHAIMRARELHLV
jgi:LuxR family maltose regulon positive regulatory protein